MPSYFDSDPVTSKELATLFQMILITPRLRPKALSPKKMGVLLPPPTPTFAGGGDVAAEDCS